MIIKLLVIFFKVLLGEDNRFSEKRLRYIFRPTYYVSKAADCIVRIPYLGFTVRFKLYMLFWFFIPVVVIGWYIFA
jgi:hypothetical protein